ncbi:DEAD/DEAH box helicase [Bacillus tianshenii]|nr:DEAD/DEAH box helicase [Bacillus tianshenii]
MTRFIENLSASLHKGFIDQSYNEFGSYTPKLLVNNTKKNENVLIPLIEELQNCQSFMFSVAFITESGLAMLKSYFLDLKQKGIGGKILTSTFLSFNQPKVFRELMKLENVEVRVTNLTGFHSKGYIFKHKTHHSLVVGSSNLTAHALKINHEWNIKLTSHENGEIINHFSNQFEDVWKESEQLTEEWIGAYERSFTPLIDKRAMDQVIDFPVSYKVNRLEEALKIKPNKMQQSALEGIQSIREAGQNKALIISATGTGKTYLSAFDVRRFAPKRMLFIVHREQILQKAMSDFKKVLGGVEEDFGILSGTNKQINVKYLFATIQTISKTDYLEKFEPNYFDYILIDEVHKAGASSYHKVINYFTPKFSLGMTATPERTDGFNIYELFDYNIAYEIRLQEALEENILTPFHYFGVTDFEHNGELIDDTTLLSTLVTEERVNHIIDKIHYYGYSGDKVRGLMFCSRKKEVEQLSAALNEKGFRTFALTGEHSQEERSDCVNQLENGELDYILTVDIFNEGIDIPSINQVVMLRQTQSSIIFIQQLGRGLRLHDSKDFVTVIDFIGNYKNNFLIPIALSGDRSYNKDNVRRRMKDTSYLKGVSTVNFEEVAKKQIFNAINKTKLTSAKILKEAYKQLKNRIGKVPYLYDFIINHSIDPVVIAEEYSNYYQLLVRMKEEVPTINSYENQVLTMLSLEILNGKRKHEIVLLELLLKEEQVTHDKYLKQLSEENCRIDERTLASVEDVMNLSFFTQVYRKKYGEEPIVMLNEERQYSFNNEIREQLALNPYFNLLIEDIIKSAKEKSTLYDCNSQLTLYKKYSRKDVCKLLNWRNDESSTVYGYKTKHQTSPIFITYHKNEDVEASVNYGDEFLNQNLLKWYTRSNRKIESEEVQQIVQAGERQNDIHIFVKKDDDEGSDFYYLGKARPDQQSVEQAEMKNKNGKTIPVVRMNMVLEHSVDYKLYQYLVDDSKMS